MNTSQPARVVLNHDDFLANVHNKALEGIADAAEFVLEEANRVVPFDEGDLADSGHVVPSQDGTTAIADVVYDTPYALIQHERTDFKHAPGRRDHYLTDTVSAHRDRIGDFLADRLKKG